MQLVFLSSLWILGALVAVPLLAHLFSKARPRRREFPSLQLLREALRQITRVRRPRDRWLLILRTLAMAALILGFLQPWLLSRFASGQGASKTVVLVVDLSASMAYADGTRTRLAQVTSSAEQILSSLPANSLANIVWIQAHANSVLPEPGPNLEFLRQALRGAAARAESGEIAGALDMALQQLKGASGDRELVVLSDFQKSAWRAVPWAVPAEIRLTRIRAGQEEAANLGIAGLALEPARPVAGQEARLSCRVRNFSSEPHRVTVFVEAGESRLSQSVEVAPWSATPVFLPVTFPKEGLAPLKATLSEDRFPGDDVRYGLADVRGPLRVGIAGPSASVTAQVWTRAAQALDRMTVQRIAPEQLENAGSFDVLLVAAWNGQAVATLRAHRAAGGALVLQPADGLDPAAIRALLGLPAESKEGGALIVQVQDAPGWQLRIVNEEHPSFAIFAGGAFGDPAGARFRRRLQGTGFPAGSPLLSYEDGLPALTMLEKPGQPALAWWNLDLNATDWPARAPFLPFFGEFLRSLNAGENIAESPTVAAADGLSQATTKSRPQRSREVEPGEAILLETGAAVDPADVRLLDSAERAVAIGPESAKAPGRLVTSQPASPGSYRWVANDAVLDRAVVSFPESESDLRQLSEAELGENGGAVLSDPTGRRLGELREGKPLWPWCLAAAASFLVLEGVCLWQGRRKPAMAGVPREMASV